MEYREMIARRENLEHQIATSDLHLSNLRRLATEGYPGPFDPERARIKDHMVACRAELHDLQVAIDAEESDDS